MRNSLLRILGVPVPLIIRREAERCHGCLREYYHVLWNEMEHTHGEPLEEILSRGWSAIAGVFRREEEMMYMEALLLIFNQEQTGGQHTLDSYLKGLEDMVIEERRERRNQRKVTIAITMMTAAMVLCMLI